MPAPTARRPRRRRLAAGAAIAVLAAAPAAAHADGWIEGPAFDVGYPAAAVDLGTAPDGSATAAWLEGEVYDPTPVRVAAQHADARGTLGPIVDLGVPDPDAVGIDVAAGAGGRSAVAWAGEAGPGGRAVRLALLRPDGSLAAPVTVAGDLRSGGPAVAVDGDGDALVAWTGFDAGADVAKAVRVAADGTVGRPVVLGPVDGDPLQVAAAPSGTGWVLRTDGGDEQVARIAPDGTLDGAVGVPADGSTHGASLVAGAGGAALARIESAGDVQRIDGVRLPVAGPVAGAPFQARDVVTDGSLLASTRPAIAPDGTIAVAWTEAQAGRGSAVVSRFAPGASTGSVTRIPAEDSPFGELLPVLAPRADGGTLAVWLAGRQASRLALRSTAIRADGSADASMATGATFSTVLSGQFGAAIDRFVQPQPTADGALLGVVDGVPAGPTGMFLSLRTRRLDAAPPQLTASIPATATAGQPVAFSASAADALGETSVWWDFGDDSGSRRAGVSHAYAVPGTYQVSVTATDAAGNAATRTGTLTVAAPPQPRDPQPRDPQPRDPQPRRSAAGLRLTSAVRAGARVTIAGRIAPSATGAIRLTYAQRSGRRTLTATTSATVARGAFRATLRLTRALARTFRLKPTVTAAYAGDAATDAATAKRTVTVRAARRAARRGSRRAGRRGGRRGAARTR